MKYSYWLALGSVCLAQLTGCNSAGMGSDEDSFAGSENGKNDNSATAGKSSSVGGPGASAGTTGHGISTGGTGTGTAAPEGEEDPSDASSAGGEGSSADEDEPRQILPANPFVITEHDPLSTFAADVDTASYDIFTSSVASGSLPPAATVRLEEFVNYFHYDYAPPAADAEHPFSISLAAAPALDPSTLLFRVGIRGRLPAVEKRAANLVFLVDTSGSMAAVGKLPLVQYTLTQALTVLDPTDKISIVSYAGSTEVRLPPTPAVTSGPSVSPGPSPSMSTTMDCGADTLPATSVARNVTVCSPGSSSTVRKRATRSRRRCTSASGTRSTT